MTETEYGVIFWSYDGLHLPEFVEDMLEKPARSCTLEHLRSNPAMSTIGRYARAHPTTVRDVEQRLCASPGLWILSRGQRSRLLQDDQDRFLSERHTSRGIDAFVRRMADEADWAIFPWGPAWGTASQCLAVASKDPAILDNIWLPSSACEINTEIESLDGVRYTIDSGRLSEVALSAVFSSESVQAAWFSKLLEQGKRDGGWLVLTQREALADCAQTYGCVEEVEFEKVMMIDYGLQHGNAVLTDLAWTSNAGALSRLVQWGCDLRRRIYVFSGSQEKEMTATRLGVLDAEYRPPSQIHLLRYVEWFLACDLGVGEAKGMYVAARHGSGVSTCIRTSRYPEIDRWLLAMW